MEFSHGLHAVISAWKAQRMPDDELVRQSFILLDLYDVMFDGYIAVDYKECCTRLFEGYPEYKALAESTAAVIAKAGEEYEECKV